MGKVHKRRTPNVVIVGLLLLHSTTKGLVPSLHKSRAILVSSRRPFIVVRHAANEEAQSQVEADKLDDPSVNGSTGGLINMNDLKSQLVSAFTNLDESDQYDAVLTGLCAKILDDTSLTSESAKAVLADPIQLLQEMNDRRIPASGRSMMALIDVGVKSPLLFDSFIEFSFRYPHYFCSRQAAATALDAKMMGQIMSLCSRNGGVSQFGTFQAELTPLPAMPTSRVKCPDGSSNTRTDRLADLPEVPTDDRGTEISSALAVASVLGFCGAVNILGFDEISPFTNLVWTLIILVGVVDNFYDILKFGASTFAGDKIGDLPQDLPLGLGSGQVTGTVVKGFSRLLQVDTERECQCEAAAFFAAYALGLPCFSFRPNSLEGAVLVAESGRKENTLDPLLTNNGVMKMLVWLMAPVAMESSKHPQLILSDPREAQGLLKRLEQSSNVNPEDLWWVGEDPREREDMLKWAYTEADLMLRRNQPLVAEIAQRLTGGAATVGDCVAAMEGW